MKIILDICIEYHKIESFLPFSKVSIYNHPQPRIDNGAIREPEPAPLRRLRGERARGAQGQQDPGPLLLRPLVPALQTVHAHAQISLPRYYTPQPSPFHLNPFNVHFGCFLRLHGFEGGGRVRLLGPVVAGPALLHEGGSRQLAGRALRINHAAVST